MTVLDLTVAIVVHNAEADVADCVQSVRRHADACGLTIVAVDSGSSDGSVEVCQTLGLKVLVRQNIGYGAGNNTALCAAESRYFLILNPDCRIVSGSLSEWISFLERNTQIGASAPRLVDWVGRPVRSLAPFQSPRESFMDRILGRPIDDRYEAVRAREHFDWAIGCALLFRRECFQEVGGFDERFFLYAEEQDLLRKVRRANWARVAYPGLTVVHDTAERVPNPRLFAQRFRAELYLARKWHGRLGVTAVRLGLAIDLLRRVVLGSYDAWTPSYLAALKVLFFERIERDFLRARELQRRRTIGPDR